MDDTLLLSKFHIPYLKTNLVTRPRLLSLLDQGLEKKLIVLSAPAGFGKTTLLSDWVQNLSYPCAWLSLDENDNDYARFQKYLVTALQQLDSNIDNTVVDLLHSPQPALRASSLTALINQVEEIKTNSILVLDDFHLIVDENIHKSIEYLLNYLPQKLHLVLSTRADPPLSFSRLRAQGELLEIRMRDLRFTDEEAKEFFQRETDVKISGQSITQLTERTEGWISGLQMATLSLRGKENVEETIQSFSGSHKYILDYLFEEVLQQQSAEVHRFLLLTSILERINGPLCDHVLDNTNSQLILEQLERDNLFLVPLDDERGWYRYHQLFKDLLTHRLSLEYPDQIQRLKQRASVWHQEAGWTDLAIDYALEAEDFDRALGLILLEAEHTLMRSEVNTYQRWLTRLPDEFSRGNSDIQFLNIWAQILQGRDFEKILSDIGGRDKLSIQSGRYAALMAFVHISKGNFSQSVKYAEQAVEKLDEQDTYFLGLAAWIRGVFYALQQEVHAAQEMLEKLSTTLEFPQNPMLNIMMRSQIAHAHTRLGNFSLAEQIYEEALSNAKDRQGNLIPIAGEALMGYGDLLREQNKLDQAADMILEGIELTQQWRKAAAIEGYLFLARVKQLQNNWKSANQALEKAMDLAVEYDAIEIDDRMVEMWQARLWAFEGKTQLVQDWVSKLDLDVELSDIVIDDSFQLENYLSARERIVLARIHLHTQQLEEALSLSDRLLVVFKNYGRHDLLIEIHLLRSMIFRRKGRKDQTMSALGEALNLGDKGGFIGSFLECGVEIKELLLSYEKRFGSSPYLQRLLAAFQDESAAPKGIVQPLLDPLSDRELDVLRYLPSNLTTPEIAEEMMISINTVRTHIKNIYQKLGVHKRSEAVKRAKELSLNR
jgi:LuxR family maltose regulon positive regulatory protein